jgi:hypothetical protein
MRDCKDCGKPTGSISNMRQRCVKCSVKKNKIDSKKNKEKHQYHKQPKYKYARYEYGAIKRGLVFELTIDEFNSFWNTNCSYCNEPIQGVGIDRKDNNIGYTKENCIPCCTICNFMKHTLSHEDFVNKCLQISKCFYDRQS